RRSDWRRKTNPIHLSQAAKLSHQTGPPLSTIVTSQVPVDHWYEIIGNPTIADAILDRLVHNAYRIELTGDSMRKRRAPENPETAQA
ncbi:ATP-binding protein, partial [Mesorhizobium xinjiangense]|uniref:ATP-binding protein n=1 Tax=Mesorhizobium xinjiangense TaxID=2678685 RepID=UPI001F24C3EA